MYLVVYKLVHEHCCDGVSVYISSLLLILFVEVILICCCFYSQHVFFQGDYFQIYLEKIRMLMLLQHQLKVVIKKEFVSWNIKQ